MTITLQARQKRGTTWIWIQVSRRALDLHQWTRLLLKVQQSGPIPETNTSQDIIESYTVVPFTFKKGPLDPRVRRKLSNSQNVEVYLWTTPRKALISQRRKYRSLGMFRKILMKNLRPKGPLVPSQSESHHFVLVALLAPRQEWSHHYYKQYQRL